ncbi:hypothetical protein FOA43_004539 [Brettanomyces nanus]|uniref:Uncharacterized protein n=1 Tax=Eeniella nana TaxID=13502 RepID=A0A875SAR0_EENNA|nr:uncharacterized protein FOA43_004539 [Brettanomyces nanus]QPG77135.1 hypothetical protein FOA43_004539 [Brettanomyces nanus]
MIRRDINPGNQRKQGRSSGGFFSRVGRIFSTPSTVSKAESNTKQKQIVGPSIVRPSKSFANTSINAASNLSAVDFTSLSNVNTTYNNRNPNDTLAEFFKRKGDAPLSEIEVEGVMSLINKSQQISQGQIFPNRTTVGIPAGNMSTNATMTTQNNSSLIHGFNNTTILRPSHVKTPVSIHTPSYKPKTRVIRRPHSQTRIVNYSGHRKRLTSPLLMKQQQQKPPSKRRIVNGGVIDLTDLGDEDDLTHKPTNGFVEIKVERKSERTSQKELSKTASKVLAILRGELSVRSPNLPSVESNTKPVMKMIGNPKRSLGEVKLDKSAAKPLQITLKSLPVAKPVQPVVSSFSHPAKSFHFSSDFSKKDSIQRAPPLKPVESLESIGSVKPVKLVKSVDRIDQFVFPDVTSSNRRLLEHLEPINGAQLTPKEVIERFSFPGVEDADSATVAGINDNTVQLYQDVFGFCGDPA